MHIRPEMRARYPKDWALRSRVHPVLPRSKPGPVVRSGEQGAPSGHRLGGGPDRGPRVRPPARGRRTWLQGYRPSTTELRWLRTGDDGLPEQGDWLDFFQQALIAALDTTGPAASWNAASLDPLFLVVRQHALRTLDALTEAILKHVVTFAFFDMSCDCQADHLRNRLTLDGRDRVQFLCLVGRQANCHRFERFHVSHCAI